MRASLAAQRLARRAWKRTAAAPGRMLGQRPPAEPERTLLLRDRAKEDAAATDKEEAAASRLLDLVQKRRAAQLAATRRSTPEEGPVAGGAVPELSDTTIANLRANLRAIRS